MRTVPDPRRIISKPVDTCKLHEKNRKIWGISFVHHITISSELYKKIAHHHATFVVSSEYFGSAAYYYKTDRYSRGYAERVTKLKVLLFSSI